MILLQSCRFHCGMSSGKSSLCRFAQIPNPTSSYIFPVLLALHFPSSSIIACKTPHRAAHVWGRSANPQMLADTEVSQDPPVCSRTAICQSGQFGQIHMYSELGRSLLTEYHRHRIAATEALHAKPYRETRYQLRPKFGEPRREYHTSRPLSCAFAGCPTCDMVREPLKSP